MPDATLAALLDRRPLLIVIAGPNGAGKTTFFQAHLAAAGLRFVNADILARELGLDSAHAASAAEALRQELIRQGESFVTETVFSDPVGAKLAQFRAAQDDGYAVVLIFIGVASSDRCMERVAMRVSQGGHDVPDDRLRARFPRVLANLRAAVSQLAAVVVLDNDDLARPHRRIAMVEHGRVSWQVPDPPAWWTQVMTP